MSMEKHNTLSLLKTKESGSILTWLTCYDYSLATALNNTELDMILVGDSGGMVVLGYPDTVPVTMDEMIMLASSVRRGAPDKFIVGDMPKGSYEVSDEVAVLNAMRFIKESRCDAVKLEGGLAMAPRIKAIVEAGIPAIGHIGLMPQSSSSQGGYRVIGRNSSELEQLQLGVDSLTIAGAFAILLEAVPPKIAKKLSDTAKIITFGIGAGKFTHGQLLILHDLLGLYPNFRPKFAKCYVPAVIDSFSLNLSRSGDLTLFGKETRADGLHEIARLAVVTFIEEVKSGTFPDDTFSYKD